MGRPLQLWKATHQPRTRHSGSTVGADDRAVSSSSSSGRPSGLVDVDPGRATSRVPTGTGGLNGDARDRTWILRSTRIAEPQLGKDMQVGGFRSAVVDGDPDEDVRWRVLRVFRDHI